MRIESLPPMAQSRSARPAPPEPAKAEPNVAQVSPAANASAAPVIPKAAPATLSGLLAIQEEARGPGPRSETKSPAHNIRALELNLAGRDFGTAVAARASGREALTNPPADDAAAVEVMPSETETSIPINLEPETSFIEEPFEALDVDDEA